MISTKKPHVVVFFGGEASNYDLSTASGMWFCNYVPRSKYQITPVEVLPDGTWKVPLGSLPSQGPIKTMWQRLFSALRPLTPAKALERILARPVDLMLTLVRGKGGDDGTLQALGQTLAIPVFGSPLSVAQQTSNKYAALQTMGEITPVPVTYKYNNTVSVDEIVSDLEDEFLQSMFIKPLTEEGSYGIAKAHSISELPGLLTQLRGVGDVLVQEDMPGTEISMTLYEDGEGKLKALPPTVIVPKQAHFYDRFAKRNPGRVTLHTPQSTERNFVVAEAEQIARDVWQKLGCRDVACFDMIAGEKAVDMLEVNTVPTFTELTPTIQQLKHAGLHPTRLFDNWISRRLV